MTTGKFDFIESDKRILEQKLRRHELSKTEYQKILKNTDDTKAQLDELKVHPEAFSSLTDKS